MRCKPWFLDSREDGVAVAIKPLYCLLFIAALNEESCTSIAVDGSFVGSWELHPKR